MSRERGGDVWRVCTLCSGDYDAGSDAKPELYISRGSFFVNQLSK